VISKRLRMLNRVCGTRFARRLLSIPAAEHQTDADAYFHQSRLEAGSFLESYGAKGTVAGRRVLDLGCGLGARTLAAARAGAVEVVGIDNDAEKIHRALEEARRSATQGVAFAVQSGSELAFAKGRFDVVLLLDVIEHLGEPAAVLCECARILREGGRVLVGFPPYRSPWGGHLFSHVPVPWVHLLFRDREVLDLWREVHAEAAARGEVRCSSRRARAIIEAESTAALWDCNGMTVGRFLDLVDRAPLELADIRFKVLGNLGGIVTKSSRLREVLTTRVMAVLEA